MRLFIAINLPEFRKLQEDIQKQMPEGLRLSKHSHITLKFLGEVDDDRVHDIARELGKIQFEPFLISLDEIDVFDSWENARVIWLKVRDHEEIKKLVHEIDNMLPMFKREKRYVPHYTLARVKPIEDKIKFRENVKSIKFEHLTTNVGSFSLMRSKLTPDGAEYEEITRFQV